MKEIIEKYRAWREADDRDEDYAYDQIHDFFSDLSRGEMLTLMDWVEKNYPSGN